VIEQRHAAATPTRLNGAHKSGGASADDNEIEALLPRILSHVQQRRSDLETIAVSSAGQSIY
jgi:hypothetical protein